MGSFSDEVLLSRTDALSSYRIGIRDYRVNNRENPFMFRDARPKLLLAEALPYAKLIED
jgi:hypothetical protein